jgi:urocanate hydratase
MFPHGSAIREENPYRGNNPQQEGAVSLSLHTNGINRLSEGLQVKDFENPELFPSLPSRRRLVLLSSNPSQFLVRLLPHQSRRVTISQMTFHPGDPVQPRILRTFTVLQQLRSDWAGSLILSVGLSPQGAALSIASNIAGAVSLAIDHDPAHLREVVRTGAVDFVVNSLDEAIRAMKNELRRGAPLSVALDLDPASALAEIAERGLAPQLFSVFSAAVPGINQRALELKQIGAELISFQDDDLNHDATPGFLSSEPLLSSLVEQRSWQLVTRTFDTANALRAFDAQALEQLSPEDTLRRRWLQSAPRILQRQRPPQRSLWLTAEEAGTLEP